MQQAMVQERPGACYACGTTSAGARSMARWSACAAIRRLMRRLLPAAVLHRRRRKREWSGRCKHVLGGLCSTSILFHYGLHVAPAMAALS